MSDAYNLEIFEIFLIKTIDTWKSIILISILAVLSGLLLGSFENILVIFLSGIIGAEIIKFSIKEYPRKWSYFLSLVNLTLFSMIIIIQKIIPGLSQSEAVWLGGGIILLNSLQVLIITVDLPNIHRILFSSVMTSSLIILGVNNLSFSPNAYALMFSGFFVILSALISQKIVKINSKARGFEFTSSLVLDKPLKIKEGSKIQRPIQKLRIKNETGEIDFLAPSFHPGLISKIGGGQLSKKIISDLNEEGVGYHLKTPVTHLSDPSSPDAIDKIIEAQPEISGEGEEQASKLLKIEREKFSLYGRRYGGKEVLMFESSFYDEIEAGIYDNALNPDKTVFIDLHGGKGTEVMKENSVEAEKLKSAINQLSDRLRTEEMFNYNAGYSIIDDKQGAVLIEKVKSEKTLFTWFNGNHLPHELKENFKDYNERDYSNSFLFTTDSHENPFELEKHPKIDKIENSIDKASKNVSSSKFYMESTISPPVKALRQDYITLMNSFNIGARFFITCLATSYLLLILLLFVF